MQKYEMTMSRQTGVWQSLEWNVHSDIQRVSQERECIYIIKQHEAHFLEIRQNGFPAPAHAAGFSPPIIVGLWTPDDESSIESASSENGSYVTIVIGERISHACTRRGICHEGC